MGGPDSARIYVIMDSLSAHKGTDIRRLAKRHKVELCFTPAYASWADPIEAHFGPQRQFTIANPKHTVQTGAPHAYLRRRPSQGMCSSRSCGRIDVGEPSAGDSDQEAPRAQAPAPPSGTVDTIGRVHHVQARQPLPSLSSTNRVSRASL